MMKSTVLAIFCLCGLTAQASAETSVSLYGGFQTAPHSVVSGGHPDGGAYSAVFGWDGKSFSPPPYYGGKITSWNGDVGTELEFTHAKVYANAADRAAAGFSRFEFTDGLNLLTVNRLRRWDSRWAAGADYVGAGAGVAFPHVDVLSDGGERTYGYQLTGPVIRLTAGHSTPIGDNWSAFAEYQFTASWNSGTLTGGGTFDTRVITNAINLGVTWRH